MKANNGITLIALIITIILLVILAIVGIKAVSSENILENTKKAKSSYIDAEIKERVTLLKNEYKIQSSTRNLEIEDLKKIANKYFSEEDLIVDGEDIYVELSTGEKYYIQESKEITASRFNTMILTGNNITTEAKIGVDIGASHAEAICNTILELNKVYGELHYVELKIKVMNPPEGDEQYQLENTSWIIVNLTYSEDGYINYIEIQ